MLNSCRYTLDSLTEVIESENENTDSVFFDCKHEAKTAELWVLILNLSLDLLRYKATKSALWQKTIKTLQYVESYERSEIWKFPYAKKTWSVPT